MTEAPERVEPAAGTTNFNPEKYLTLVNGKEYLEVRWRIKWFRTDFPEGRIETDLVSYTEREAVVKATVTAIRDGAICGVSSDYGSETPQDFGDYLEKASTKAIGRALASLGFGTQFTTEHDFGADQGRVVDSPVARGGGSRETSNQARPQPQQSSSGEILASDPQMGAIYGIQKSMNWTDVETGDLAHDLFGVRDTGRKGSPNITKAQASQLIEAMNAAKVEGQGF